MLIAAAATYTTIKAAATILLLTSAVILPDANPSLYFYDKFLLNKEKKIVKSFQGKNIWITGASSGIGAELANQLHSYGANVILSSRNRQDLLKQEQRLNLQQQQQQCFSTTTTADTGKDNIDVCENNKSATQSVKNEIRILPFDMTTDDETLSSTVKEALTYFNGIDILILNAGRGQLSPALDENNSFDTTRNLMELNFMGPVRLAMEVIKQNQWGEYFDEQESLEDDKAVVTKKKKRRKRKGGHIVVTSSIAAKLALPLGSSYAASKHAIQGFFVSLRSECSEWLRVDLPCPGPVATDFLNRVQSPENNKIGREDAEEVEVTKPQDDNQEGEAKMPVKRCARLIISSMVGPSFFMKETWIVQQPTLGFLYFNQFFPNLCSTLLGKLGSLRVKAFQAKLPLYKVSSWIKASKMMEDQ